MLEKTQDQRKSVIFTDSHKHIPKSISISKFGNITASNFMGATHILVDVLERKLKRMEVVYDLYGVSVSAVLIPSKHVTAVYMDLNQHMVPRNTEVLAAISSHFADYPYYYNDPASLDNIPMYVEKEYPEIVGKKCAPRVDLSKLHKLEKTKISGEHHIHFTAEEIYKLLTPGERKKAKFATFLPSEASTTFVAGVMLWLATLDDDLFLLISKAGLFKTTTLKEFAKVGKLISVRAKSLQNIVPRDLRAIFEIDVLINRYTGDPVWEQEKKNRTEPNLADVSPDRVYLYAKQLFQEAQHHAAKPKRMDWDRFWKSRWQWTATGSIHSQYNEDGVYIEKARELKNKFITLCKFPKTPMEYFSNRIPEIRAWTSTKYEWGKQRAIYGTDLTSYILTHFVFYNCEDTLPKQFPVGTKARPSYVASQVQATLTDREAFCLDFEDFNSQHSNENMQAVMNAWLDVHARDLDPEQLKAGRWAVDSISNTIIEDKMGTGTTYRSMGTLMSGHRLTTFLNSVLNSIYTSILVEGNKERPRSVHNGDDVLMGIRAPALISTIMENAQKYNIRVQKTKCAYGGIAEFLRVDHKRGEFGQYATRSIATLMHARIESKMAISVVDCVEAMESRLFDFVVRTKKRNLAARLRNDYYSRVARIYNVTKHDLYIIKTSHRVVGGISDKKDAPVNRVIEFSKTSNEVELDKHLPGVWDYSEKLVRDLEMEIPIIQVYKNIYQSTLDAVQLVRKKCFISLAPSSEQYKVDRGIYKAYKHLSGDATIGKAMLTGFSLDILGDVRRYTTLTKMLATASDKMRYLRIVI